MEGGDLYESQKKFYDFVASRSEQEVREKASLLSCPILEIEATLSVEEIVGRIIREWLRRCYI